MKVRVTKLGVSPQERIVDVIGFDKLTPKAAQIALMIAFGTREGKAWWEPPSDHKIKRPYGYRVYANSARKLKVNDNG